MNFEHQITNFIVGRTTKYIENHVTDFFVKVLGNKLTYSIYDAVGAEVFINIEECFRDYIWDKLQEYNF